jgi:hypothetical protein
MSETGEAKAKRDAGASGAKPRPEGRVREQRRRPTREGRGLAERFKEAARRRASAWRRNVPPSNWRSRAEAPVSMRGERVRRPEPAIDQKVPPSGARMSEA